jgi:outer membrane immunogenic protein
MKFNVTTFVAACAALAAGAAQAADLRPITKAPPVMPVAVYNWTGFYVGAHGGWARTDKTWTLGGLAVADYNVAGGIYGGQLGFNWQSGNWVFGAEVQASFGEIRKGVLWIDPDPDPANPFWVDPDPAPVVGGRVLRVRTGTTVEHLGTIAGRIGYAFDNVLVFAKGGAAWTHDVYRAFNANTDTETLIASATGTRWGWMIGGGIEYGFAPNWSAKIEANYIDLGTERITLVSIPGVTPATRYFDIEQSVTLVKAGINYRFGAGPVVARY